ncbi:MAG: HD domain-containing protein [Clostridiaceae bacterium]|nr:HD domain-containing protein [Clostridiaceae bacterium]
MDVRKFIEIMSVAEKLKNNTRHSWTSSNRHESVAEHSWRLSLMAYFVKDEFPDADINKVILMCIVHDLGEAITGDIPAFKKTADDEIIENIQVNQLLDSLPEPYRKELSMLFIEMNEQKNIESKIFKALDRIEALIQHNEADISTWLPLEYDLNLTYGEKEAEFSEYMKELRKAVNEDTVNKIQRSKESVS